MSTKVKRGRLSSRSLMGSAMKGPELVFTKIDLLMGLFNSGFSVFGLSWFEVSTVTLDGKLVVSVKMGFTSGSLFLSTAFSVHNAKLVIRHVVSYCAIKCGSTPTF